MLTHAFDLPLRHIFTISRDSTSVQPTLIVELQEEGIAVSARRPPTRTTGYDSTT